MTLPCHHHLIDLGFTHKIGVAYWDDANPLGLGHEYANVDTSGLQTTVYINAEGEVLNDYGHCYLAPAYEPKPAAHWHLLDMGFAYIYCRAHWEDVGGPESGPMIQGYPAYHAYDAPYGDDGVISVFIDLAGEAFMSIDPLAEFE